MVYIYFILCICTYTCFIDSVPLENFFKYKLLHKKEIECNLATEGKDIANIFILSLFFYSLGGSWVFTRTYLT